MEEAGISVLSIETGAEGGGGITYWDFGLPLVLGRCGFELNYGNVLGHEF